MTRSLVKRDPRNENTDSRVFPTVTVPGSSPGCQAMTGPLVLYQYPLSAGVDDLGRNRGPWIPSALARASP